MKKVNKRESFLFGDYNYNILDCEKPHISNFVDEMFGNEFIPLINKPTRISLNSASLLDHIWINNKTTLNLNYGILTYCVSDHLPVFLSTSIEKLKQPIPTFLH